MIGDNYPIFYSSQVKRKQREQVLILSLIVTFLLVGIIAIFIGYLEISRRNGNDVLHLVDNAYANVNYNVQNDSINLVDVIVPLIDLILEHKFPVVC